MVSTLLSTVQHHRRYLHGGVLEYEEMGCLYLHWICRPKSGCDARYGGLEYFRVAYPRRCHFLCPKTFKENVLSSNMPDKTLPPTGMPQRSESRAEAELGR